MPSSKKQKIEHLLHLSQKNHWLDFLVFGPEMRRGQFLTTKKIFKIILRNGVKGYRMDMSTHLPYWILFIQKFKNPQANPLGYSWGDSESVRN